MKILLSAFACAPNTGSEGGVGWNYACRLAALGHQVWVLTDESRRPAIEAWGPGLPLGMSIVFYRPSLFQQLRMSSRTAHLIYQAWQMGAWRVAQRLDAEHDFDVCWHLTYGVFRQPSWMWKVGKPFVFGPVGGGERSPLSLRKGMPPKALAVEFARDAANFLCWFLPGLDASYRNACLILARTEDTRAILPDWIRDQVIVQQEIGGLPARFHLKDKASSDGTLSLFFAGRLLAWKGIHLALRAFEIFLSRGGKGRFTIIGEGPMEPLLRDAARSFLEHVEFIPRLPQDELFRRYPDFDVLLFPSLHDSGGNVVIESLSFGVPVVCLDLGGPPCFVDDSCGHVVATAGLDVDGVVEELAAALMRMHSDAPYHHALCAGALRRADAMTLDKQIDRVISLVQERVAVEQKRTALVSAIGADHHA